MNIAVTVWGNRVSPVFDSSRNLMITSIEECAVAGREFKPFNPKDPTDFMQTFHQNQIDVLICGAITQTQSSMIEADSIRLISFVTGFADDILASYIENPDQISLFNMPGAGRQAAMPERDDNLLRDLP